MTDIATFTILPAIEDQRGELMRVVPEGVRITSDELTVTQGFDYSLLPVGHAHNFRIEHGELRADIELLADDWPRHPFHFSVAVMGPAFDVPATEPLEQSELMDVTLIHRTRPE